MKILESPGPWLLVQKTVDYLGSGVFPLGVIMGSDEMMAQFKKLQPATPAGAGQSDPAQFEINNNQNDSSRANALKHKLNADEKDFIQHLSEALPPVIGRAEVDRFPPGLVKPQTLTHADSVGLGPEVAWKSVARWPIERISSSYG